MNEKKKKNCYIEVNYLKLARYIFPTLSRNRISRDDVSSKGSEYFEEINLRVYTFSITMQTPWGHVINAAWTWPLSFEYTIEHELAILSPTCFSLLSCTHKDQPLKLSLFCQPQSISGPFSLRSPVPLYFLHALPQSLLPIWHLQKPKECFPSMVYISMTDTKSF